MQGKEGKEKKFIREKEIKSGQNVNEWNESK